jgi:hypothetical protein
VGCDGNEHDAAKTVATIRDLIDIGLAIVFAKRRYNSTFSGARKPADRAQDDRQAHSRPRNLPAFRR